jgi:glucose/arabinose dehydrogenase
MPQRKVVVPSGPHLYFEIMRTRLLHAAVWASALVPMAAHAQPTWNLGTTVLTETNLVTGVQLPWEILWGPDDHLWVTTRPGDVLRVDPATGIYTTVLELTVMNNGSGEPGLLGMAMHPEWESTPKVFLVYCTGSGASGSERLSVFDWDGVSLVNEQVLLTISAGGIHNGSRLLVLPDNTLLMTTGDVGNTGNAQNLNSSQGKILRLNLDGSIPADNPDPTSAVYTYGNRNAQGLALGPDGIVYSSEHGQNSDDELNIVLPGRNYGWPTVQGLCNTASEQTFCEANNVMEPLKVWTPCVAVNGLEYYNHPAIPEWQHSLLLSVLGGLNGQYERLSVLHLSADGQSITSEDQWFSSFNQRVRDIAVNPYDGSVYVALNGVSYPGSGPNIIKQFRNASFGVDVAEHAETPAPSAYPVPASDLLTLEIPQEWQGSEVRMFSYTGSQVAAFRADASHEVVEVQDWSEGLYFAALEAPDGRKWTVTFSVVR